MNWSLYRLICPGWKCVALSMCSDTCNEDTEDTWDEGLIDDSFGSCVTVQSMFDLIRAVFPSQTVCSSSLWPEHHWSTLCVFVCWCSSIDKPHRDKNPPLDQLQTDYFCHTMCIHWSCILRDIQENHLKGGRKIPDTNIWGESLLVRTQYPRRNIHSKWDLHNDLRNNQDASGSLGVDLFLSFILRLVMHNRRPKEKTGTCREREWYCEKQEERERGRAKKTREATHRKVPLFLLMQIERLMFNGTLRDAQHPAKRGNLNHYLKSTHVHRHICM